MKSLGIHPKEANTPVLLCWVFFLTLIPVICASANVQPPSTSVTLAQDKTYLVFSCTYGNLNNQLNIILNTLYSVYKSPHRDRIRIVMPRVTRGTTPVFSNLFENALDFDFVDFDEFITASNIFSILDEATFYGTNQESVIDAQERRFKPGFFEDWHLKVAFSPQMNRRDSTCPSLRYVDLAYEQCVGWDPSRTKATKDCKSFLIPPAFTNMNNCSTDHSGKYLDWGEFRAKIFVPTEKYKQNVQEQIDAMERPVMALHLRFLPFGMGLKLYREPYGSWKEGTLPPRFSIPLFINRSKQLYECLETHHGWKMPKSIYLLGWPRLIGTLSKPLESMGVEIYTRNAPGHLDPILVDELVALEADYFHSSFRSTLTLNIAEARVASKGHSGHQFLPDCLPNYGIVYNPDMANSPCVQHSVEPQH